MDHDLDFDDGPLRRCLVVDDSSVIRKVARIILDDLNFEVLEAGDCKEAKDLCRGVPPNIILLDWRLPDQNSIEFLRELRLRRHAIRPFIVYMTTENDVEDIRTALKAGADDFLLKPFTRQTINDKIEPLSRLVAIS